MEMEPASRISAASLSPAHAQVHLHGQDAHTNPSRFRAPFFAQDRDPISLVHHALPQRPMRGLVDLPRQPAGLTPTAAIDVRMDAAVCHARHRLILTGHHLLDQNQFGALRTSRRLRCCHSHLSKVLQQ